MAKKEIVINRAKWRTATHGEGTIELLNNEGYKCCLGFLVGQTTKCKIKDHCTPSSCSKPPKEFEKSKAYECESIENLAMGINDNKSLTDKEREKELKKLFSKKSKLYKLKFVGKYNDKEE